jgi:hypothetical protein
MPEQEKVCERCNGSGVIGRSIYYPMAYVGPGPVPDYAQGVCEATCDECQGDGIADAGLATPEAGETEHG